LAVCFCPLAWSWLAGLLLVLCAIVLHSGFTLEGSNLGSDRKTNKQTQKQTQVEAQDEAGLGPHPCAHGGFIVLVVWLEDDSCS
jgi:hypothetical protein